MRVGLISDTHDLLRPGARDFLRGCERILHAGDVCGPAVLCELAELAPVVAVRGNNDRGEWAAALREEEVLDIGGVRVLMIHDLKRLGAVPTGTRVVISGHSHRPKVEEQGGVLYVNPGSAGPRRFKLPISLGELLVEGGKVSARIVELSP